MRWFMFEFWKLVYQFFPGSASCSYDSNYIFVWTIHEKILSRNWTFLLDEELILLSSSFYHLFGVTDLLFVQSKYPQSHEKSSSTANQEAEVPGIHIFSWTDCLNLPMLAVLTNSTLSTSRLLLFFSVSFFAWFFFFDDFPCVKLQN